MHKNIYCLIAIIASLTFLSPSVHCEPPHSPKGKHQLKLGRQLVHKKKCSVCHAINGKGGKLAGPLNGITEGRTDEFLKGSLLDPKATLGPKTTMPAYAFTEVEVNAVIAFMKGLKKPEGP